MQPVNPEASANNRRVVLLVCLGIILATCLLYCGVWTAGFVDYDDNTHVYQNADVRAGLCWQSVRSVFWTPEISLWVPLSLLTHCAEVEMFGLNPLPMHLLNVALHAAAAVMLLLALRRLTGRFWPGAVVAAMFAMHPISVESVAWITERKNTLSALLIFISLHAWAGYARRGDAKSWWVALAAFALALMAKPIVTLPCVFLLFDVWPLRRLESLGWGKIIREKIPFFLLSAAASLLAVLSTTQTGSKVPLAALPFPTRLANALWNYADYLRDLAAPTRLACLHPLRFTADWGLAGLGAAVVLGVTLAAILLRKKHPPLLIGWLIYLGMAFPTIGLVQTGNLNKSDHFLYLPQIGIWLAVVWLADALLRGARAKTWAAIIAVLGYAWMTPAQVSKWETSATLYEHAATVVPHNYRALHFAGRAWRDQGQLERAAELFSKAAAPGENDEAWADLGAAQLSLGRDAAATHSLLAAVAIAPKNPGHLFNLSLALERTGALPQAVNAQLRAIAAAPGYAPAHYRLGQLRERAGALAEARAAYAEAARLAPESTVFQEAARRLNP